MKNMRNMMKQVQKMQSEMAKTQEALGEKSVEASAGGGAVIVTFNGQQELQSIAIDPSAVDPEDVEMLQDLVLTAVNEGLRQSREVASEAMSKVTGGLNIPGLPQF